MPAGRVKETGMKVREAFRLQSCSEESAPGLWGICDPKSPVRRVPRLPGTDLSQ